MEYNLHSNNTKYQTLSVNARSTLKSWAVHLQGTNHKKSPACVSVLTGSSAESIGHTPLCFRVITRTALSHCSLHSSGNTERSRPAQRQAVGPAELPRSVNGGRLSPLSHCDHRRGAEPPMCPLAPPPPPVWPPWGLQCEDWCVCLPR